VRSGATNVQPLAIDGLNDARLNKLTGRADAVLVDAPCTGSGTLRRNPELKWRMQPADVDRLVLEQRSILAAAARLVKPGGVLVYGTCSLLAEENIGNVAWFEASHPTFQREPADEVLRAQGLAPASDAVFEGLLALSPERHGTDGFFGVRWRRSLTVS
jgi:16S rRNA (cytosine967-C5)-methyltransferase